MNRTEYFRLYFREARSIRKRLGLCLHCGKEPALPGHTMCDDCNDNHNQADARYRRKHWPATSDPLTAEERSSINEFFIAELNK